jgi:methylglyoxal synthase
MRKALLRLAVLWNIPIACNRASADFMISSPLMDGEYDRLVPDYEEYRTRKIVTSEKVDPDAADFAEDEVLPG